MIPLDTEIKPFGALTEDKTEFRNERLICYALQLHWMSHFSRKGLDSSHRTV